MNRNLLTQNQNTLKAFGKKCQQLARYPYIGKSSAQLKPGLRGISFMNHIIFYRVLEDRVEIFASGQRLSKLAGCLCGMSNEAIALPLSVGAIAEPTTNLTKIEPAMSLSSNAMQITLSTDQSRVLEALSQQGGYASMADAVDMALVLLAETVTESSVDDDPEYLAWIEQTRRKIEAGIEAADRGEVLDANTVLAQLLQKVEAARAATE